MGPYVAADARALASGRSLLTRAVLYRFLNLLLHRFKVERSRTLHRRKFDRGLREISDVLLDHDEAPELPGKEFVHVAGSGDVQGLAANTRRALEGILADVDHSGHVGRVLFARPAPRLGEEREFEVTEAKRAQARTAEVEDFLTLGWASPGEKIGLVVAVEMVLVGPVAEPRTSEELVGESRSSGCAHWGGEPIQMR